jgi:opacity protein-like surface antigen
MKKYMAMLMVLALAAPAMAQFIGLPIAGGAAAPEVGQFGISGGAVINDDVNGFGGRVSFAPAQGLSLFGDVGILDWDTSGVDNGLAVQAGALFTLPVDLPVDMAVRGTVGMTKTDIKGGGDISTFDLGGGLLVSKAFDAITPYGYVGIQYTDAEVDTDGFGKQSDDDTELAIGGGVSFALNDQFSLYGEMIYIDDPFFGVGGRFRF